MIDQQRRAELYLSFAGVFHRPTPAVSRHLEEFIDLWEETIPAIDREIKDLREFLEKHPEPERRLEALWEHYIPLFETGKVEAVPFASVHLNPEGQVMGEEALAVSRFYRRAGYDIAQGADQLPDHVAVELEFMALLTRDGQEQWAQEFRETHLLPFLAKLLPLIECSRRPVYAPVARILRTWQDIPLKEGK